MRAQVLIVQYEQELKDLDAAVMALKKEFSVKTSEAEQLKLSVEKAEGTLAAARNLLDKLSGEKVRYAPQAHTHTCMGAWLAGPEVHTHT